ncbi:hypothetical protein EMIHUDRAFT_439469 [Emiliania huxleyi CCMP1516]|uniref:aldehyde dehydrogenase (NAD(+)) n=2 Tax=Emiliania huxleyi TaxID=2903 RepID=A0A0D3IQR7_EMIH1|nr:putative alcohol dehydrogenase [Emiliania huxleyi CCMP1516]XP_005793251.1 hypothetical protein EMIHUDRAFT_439469 [Emiliania huxleyi CCMP1516]EOD13602.1 putative alcohol dehydrogenase [Emiliania huxleyi CCMP1516]EOD40822.1 hypothetical protein EMIHUDRAFT_439469 [Emiliania huxleyi CCMP1516]|eukprot:XP_005766031.1 putative alcohol dehydrogenase [Emiliania huxleyi CCMP1516]
MLRTVSHLGRVRALGFSRARAASAIPVYSPRDGKVFTEIPDATVADVEAAVEAAASVQASGWSKADAVDQRAESLLGIAAALTERKDELAELESQDCGKPVSETAGDIQMCIDVFEYMAELAPKMLKPSPIALPDGDFRSSIVPAAAGVVGAITPWNYPLMQAAAKVAPALAAGCSVLLKPSPLASLTCLKLGEIGRENGLPEGALTVITGGPPDGKEGGADCLTNHPRLDLLSFTGSSAAGSALLHCSANKLRRSSLELGGKGALLVFEDASIDAAVDWAMVGIFSAAGQVCSATSRLLVHESIATELLKALEETTVALRVGDPKAEGTQMGPVISATQRDRIAAAVRKAEGEGVEVLVGGSGPPDVPGLEGGYYVKPTILNNVPVGSSAWCEEIFGPVLCVRTFKTEEEAVRLANDSPYGLGHAVLSADEARADRVAAQLDAGNVWVNCNQALWAQTPFGGWKASGFGFEYGEAGLHEYLRHKTVTSARQPGYSWKAYHG